MKRWIGSIAALALLATNLYAGPPGGHRGGGFGGSFSGGRSGSFSRGMQSMKSPSNFGMSARRGGSFTRSGDHSGVNLGSSLSKRYDSSRFSNNRLQSAGRPSRLPHQVGSKLPSKIDLKSSPLDRVRSTVAPGTNYKDLLRRQATRRDRPLGNDLKSTKLSDLYKNPKTLGRLEQLSRDHDRLSKLDWRRNLGSLDQGRIDRLVSGKAAQSLQLAGQLKLHQKGDLARLLNTGKQLSEHGGWHKRSHGPLHKNYLKHGFHAAYCGPSWYPKNCWYPTWTTWLDWCYRPTYHYDPRPVYCRPIACDPCPDWTVYDYPAWQSLPVVSCGTWVDVAPLTIDEGVDLQLLAVRMVDNGHPEQKLGPRYRVWLRNNSSTEINVPFSVLLLAASSEQAEPGLPHAGVTVPSIDAQATVSVDVRLPVEANATGITFDQISYPKLHVLVDSHRQIAESIEDNNGTVLSRTDVLPVDPVVFNSSEEVAAEEQVLNLAGEGLGPEAGQVLLRVGDLELQGEIEGWHDLGARVKLPSLPLASDTDAELIIVRGDGTVTNPVGIKLASASTSSATSN